MCFPHRICQSRCAHSKGTEGDPGIPHRSRAHWTTGARSTTDSSVKRLALPTEGASSHPLPDHLLVQHVPAERRASSEKEMSTANRFTLQCSKHFFSTQRNRFRLPVMNICLRCRVTDMYAIVSGHPPRTLFSVGSQALRGSWWAPTRGLLSEAGGCASADTATNTHRSAFVV